MPYRLFQAAASTPAPAPAPSSAPTSAVDLFPSIVAQGETVRQLKAAKAPKDQVDKAVQQLLSLKVHQQPVYLTGKGQGCSTDGIPFLFLQAQFKEETGLDYKPGMAPPTSAPAPAAPRADSSSCPYTRVTQQGDLVRKLKAEQAPKVHGHFFRFSPHLRACLLTRHIPIHWSTLTSVTAASCHFPSLLVSIE